MIIIRVGIMMLTRIRLLNDDKDLLRLSTAPLSRVLIRRSLVDMTENILGVIFL